MRLLDTRKIAAWKISDILEYSALEGIDAGLSLALPVCVEGQRDIARKGNDMEKLILTVATTGSGTPISKYPNLPCTPKAIADEVYKCYQAGAVCAHLHAREDDGTRSMRFERFKETVERIRDKCDILINLTTSGMEFPYDMRMEPLSLKPDLASYNSGSMNFGRGVFPNSLDFLEKLATRMDEYHVKPEIEVYDCGMIINAIKLCERGYLKPPLHFQLVLGIDGGLPATPKNVVFMVDMLPPGSTWSVVGVGRYSMMMWSMAIHMGGHVRFGTEDNIYIRKGRLAQSSVDFVEQVKRMADLFERPIANLQEAKQILHLAG